MADYESKFIKFFRQYGPIPRNDCMYDESIQRTLRREKVTPIAFESEFLSELVKLLSSDKPSSVILTGTAGDGKTFYCREIWQKLGGTIEAWEAGGKIQSIPLKTGTQLHIIKDLSELTVSDRNSYLPQIADAIVGSGSDFYLIAANDGQLIEAWKQVSTTSRNASTIKSTIEDLLLTDRREKPDLRLCLYNLSKVSAAKMMPRILDAILKHPGWGECEQCQHNRPASSAKNCPIWENRVRLEGTTPHTDVTRNRLTDLLELCELNGSHLSVRQLLILVANTVLGHPDSKDGLMSCRDVPRIIEAGTTASASLYRNILGENLSERRRDSTTVFSTLGRFGIGHETNNRIDNTLIFGSDDPELQPLFDALVLSDAYYGADAGFKSAQRGYLEGTMEDGGKEFLDRLRSQRQRLFFTIPPDQVRQLKLWELTVFQFAGTYLEEVFRALLRNERIPKQVLTLLVRGLNRAFTGLLIKNQDELILATSGSYSQARVSRVLEESISVPKKRGESVQITMEHGKPCLVVTLAVNERIPPVNLHLKLVRFEFLCRVAEGSLPDSFSRECYEDILAFKTDLLRKLEKRRIEEQEDDTGNQNQLALRLIDLDSDGMIKPRLVEVRI